MAAPESAKLAPLLVIPFGEVGGAVAGTRTKRPPTSMLWFLSHDDRRFDREDARIVASLSGFTRVALQLAAR